jgi:AraC-like DNA-binding protein
MAARAVGLDPYRMLRKAGLPPAALDTPHEQISARRYLSLLEDSANTLSSPEFGLIVAENYGLPMAGMIGLLLRQQPTVGEAVEKVSRYLGYQMDAVEIRPEPGPGGGQVLKPSFHPPELATSRVFVDMMLGSITQILRALLGPAWRPTLTLFTHGPPIDERPYRALFGPVAFGQPSNGILLTQAELASPIAGADPALADEIARFIERSSPRLETLTLIEQVSELIDQLLPEGRCSIEEVARHLGVDRRTVHRRLAQESTSFGELVEAARRDIIARQLPHPQTRLADLASRLGFSSPSTFSRWFHSVYGVQPSEFRRMMGRDPRR